ncbi:MAG TPA: hypothetical protein ENN67_05560, partial [Firmicutes bacterium]|nr:hypothetical protein [Bacillota bacterium]
MPGRQDNFSGDSVVFKREWPSILFVALFVSIMTAPFVFAGKDLLPDYWMIAHPWARMFEPTEPPARMTDPVYEFNPWFQFAQEMIKEGEFPHWNPYQCCGMPFYANRLVPIFYPPFLIATLLSSPSRLLGWFQFMNLVISGLGMYFLLRRWRISPSAASISSCLFLTTTMNFIPYPVWTLGISGFPWLIWALDGYLEKPKIMYIGIAGLIFGSMLIAGYPILIVHLTYMTGMYFFARIWFFGAGRERWKPSYRWAVPILVMLAIFILGLGISAVSNVPGIVMLQKSQREMGGFKNILYKEMTTSLEFIRQAAKEVRND